MRSQPLLTSVLCLIAVLIPGHSAFSQRRVEFSGTVHAGDIFRKDIGRGLEFVARTTQGSEDVFLEVHAKSSASGKGDNFVTCVTPPFHGGNPADLYASDFVSEAALSEVMFQRERIINFVLTKADNDKACKELNVALYGPVRESSDGPVQGTPGYKPPPLGRVMFYVESEKISPVVADQRPRFESVSFSVEITFPESAARSKPSVKRVP